VADGDFLLQTPGQLSYLLLDSFAATGTGNGVWVDTKGYQSGIVVITGAATTAVVEVDVSNDATKPANANHGATHTALAAGASGQVTLLVLPRWVKARVSTSGTGTVIATVNFTSAVQA